MLKKVGFWNNRQNEYPQYPMPKKDAANYDIERMFKYLSDGILAVGYRGTSHCRICRDNIGSREYVDGSYLWPEGLPHYVKEHQIELPDEFVNHVVSNQYDIRKAIKSIEDESVSRIINILSSDLIPKEAKYTVGSLLA